MHKNKLTMALAIMGLSLSALPPPAEISPQQVQVKAESAAPASQVTRAIPSKSGNTRSSLSMLQGNGGYGRHRRRKFRSGKTLSVPAQKRISRKAKNVKRHKARA